MLTHETQYITKAALIRKLVSAYRRCELDVSTWPEDHLNRIAEVSIDALNAAAEITHQE